MQRKSQSALEFLTTYGWAFLVIIIMIGTLAYFGILSPSKLLPNRCNFGSEFQCLDYRITTSELRMRLKNNVGEPITVDAGDIIRTSESVVGYSCPTSPAISPWKSGEVQELVYACSGGGLVQNQKGKILVSIKYYPVASGPNYKKEVKGEIFSAVI